ncbi:MAG TPA: hemolysin family protein [Terracidiphilus sp.]|nr:hemolysin family protein [Terracidiphilus sp.]
MHGLLLFKPVTVALLILANAYFVAAEFALVSIRETRVEQLLEARVPGARAVRRLQRNLDDLLPAVQLGVTLCSLALGWLGEPLAAQFLGQWIGALPHAQIYGNVAALVLGFCLITYLHVVAGELVPKALALRRAEALAVAVAPPMLVFMAVARPAVRLLSRSASAILRGFDIPKTERAASIHSAEELKLIATAARRLDVIPEFQEVLVHRALELSDVVVREIMTPRQRIFSLPSNMLLEEAIARVLARNHSRIPVYDEARGTEHIVGAVYARDLARLFYQRATTSSVALPPAEMRLAQIMHEVLVVPESKSALELLRDFKQNRRHLAIVVDEYGSTVGLVTAEDAIEQLAGELEDEFDAPSHPVLGGAGEAVLMDGSVNLRDLETQLDWSLPRDGGVETLAGFVLARLGHIPQPGESVVYEDRRLTVMEMDARRIAKIRVEKVECAAAEAE